jgi:CrcB protein
MARTGHPAGELSPGDDGPPRLADPASTELHRKSSVTSQYAMLISIVVIAIGGSLGCLLRWYFALRLNGQFPNLPPGTLTANLVGGYLIGVAMAVFIAYPELSPQLKLLIVTGFLGGLTTFSSFSAEVVTALLSGRAMWAVATIAVHVVGSITMTILGVLTVRLLRHG